MTAQDPPTGVSSTDTPCIRDTSKNKHKEGIQVSSAFKVMQNSELSCDARNLADLRMHTLTGKQCTGTGTTKIREKNTILTLQAIIIAGMKNYATRMANNLHSSDM